MSKSTVFMCADLGVVALVRMHKALDHGEGLDIHEEPQTVGRAKLRSHKVSSTGASAANTEYRAWGRRRVRWGLRLAADCSGHPLLENISERNNIELEKNTY